MPSELSEPPAFSKTDKLRKAVTDATDDISRLDALLALARHFADVSDGVNGLATARAARLLATRLKNFKAVSHALNSASVSHYHRSDYLSAVATAMDAWDYARRVDAKHEIAESYFAVGLSLLALGEVDDAMKVVENGLVLTAQSEDLLAPHVMLIGLKAMAFFRLGQLDETERYCAETVRLSTGIAESQLALSHGNWGIALLRAAEQRIDSGKDAQDYLKRSNEHLKIALQLAVADADVMRVADRISGLGQVALSENKLVEAEKLLTDALRRSQALDYVRTTVISAVCLGKLYLRQGYVARAIEMLKMAVSQAKRGAPADIFATAKLLLADALERNGEMPEAASLRALAEKLQNANKLDRSIAAEDARRLAARVLAA